MFVGRLNAQERKVRLREKSERDLPTNEREDDFFESLRGLGVTAVVWLGLALGWGYGLGLGLWFTV